MDNEQTSFRARLLEAQRMTPGLREEYRRELDALVNCRLTPRRRLYAWGILLALLVSAGLCVRSFIIFRAQPDSRIILPAYAAVCLAFAAWIGWILWKGVFARRASFVVIEGLGSVAVSVFVFMTIVRAMHSPSDPGSIFGGIMAILFVMVAFAWGTGNRMAAANLEMREHLLRIESRLADLSDRIAK